jgi:putative colanic acid biosynthesis UDP-glucose lipid carrier transferase
MKQDIIFDAPVQDDRQTVIIPQTDMASIRYLFHQMNQQVIEHQPSAYYFRIKRVMDLTISALFIISVMSWLAPLIAILIKLTSKGPIFFVQKRTGYMGEEFNCYKFRTMYVNDEADIKQVSINDTRITMIGRILRITHLDETPQFINVIKGEMSVVGPRPHMIYHTNFYSERIPYYNLRLEVLPGMTGMAQIKDYIGEISVERELRKRIQWDVYYMRHRSIWLDIKILFETGKGVFTKIKALASKKKI